MARKDCNYLCTHLVEADIVGVLPEALTAQAEAIFTDQTMVVGAGAAERGRAYSSACGQRERTNISVNPAPSQDFTSSECDKYLSR